MVPFRVDKELRQKEETVMVTGRGNRLIPAVVFFSHSTRPCIFYFPIRQPG